MSDLELGVISPLGRHKNVFPNTSEPRKAQMCIRDSAQRVLRRRDIRKPQVTASISPTGMGRPPLTGRGVHSRVAHRAASEADIHGAINNASEATALHASEIVCRRGLLMGANRSERAIIR